MPNNRCKKSRKSVGGGLESKAEPRGCLHFLEISSACVATLADRLRQVVSNSGESKNRSYPSYCCTKFQYRNVYEGELPFNEHGLA